MGPLSPQNGDDFEHLLGFSDHLQDGFSLQGFIPPHRLFEERVVLVGRVDKVGGEHQKTVAHIALDMLYHQGQIPDFPGAVGHFRRSDHVQGLGRRGQVGGTADAADAGRDHQPVEGAAADQDLFEAAEHGPGTPDIGDLPVLDLDLDFQIPFNPVYRNIE